MTNHLHLVVIQGIRPLGTFMQPLLTSIARAVQSAHGVEGHVFERRYRHTACMDIAHLRNAIAYTHANPVRAGLCEHPADYRWSSHLLYTRRARRLDRGPLIDVATGLTMFTSDHPSTQDPASCYVEYIESILAPVQDESPTLPGPGATFPGPGDVERERGQTDPISPASGAAGGPDRAPLERIAAGVLEGGPFGSLEEVTSRWGSRARFDVRAEIAAAGSQAGWSGREIAGFLNVSESAVSKMLRRVAGLGV